MAGARGNPLSCTTSCRGRFTPPAPQYQSSPKCTIFTSKLKNFLRGGAGPDLAMWCGDLEAPSVVEALFDRRKNLMTFFVVETPNWWGPWACAHVAHA